MYEVLCDSCGKVGFHPSRVGAEGRAEHHFGETGHNCDIAPMQL